MLIRKKLYEGEFSSPFLRYSADCDCIEFTPDGGETWIPQPANDPRTSDAYRLPALTGSDTQCRAAEGMVTLIRMAVDKRLATDTEIEFAGGILGIVAFIPGFNILWALILALASFAVTIARELLEAAFTEDVYDALRCIFFCHTDENGQMSQDQFDDAYADLIDLNPLARTWAQKIMELVGCVGMSDAGVALEGAADCECECGWCREIDFSIDDGGFDPCIGDYGVYDPGVGWRQTPGQGLVICRDFDSVGTVTRVTYSGQSSDGSAYGWSVYLRLSGVNVYVHDNPGSGIAYETTFETGGVECDEIWLNPHAGSTSSQLITSCVLRGTGDNPLGGDNC